MVNFNGLNLSGELLDQTIKRLAKSEESNQQELASRNSQLVSKQKTLEGDKNLAHSHPRVAPMSYAKGPSNATAGCTSGSHDI